MAASGRKIIPRLECRRVNLIPRVIRPHVQLCDLTSQSPEFHDLLYDPTRHGLSIPLIGGSENNMIVMLCMWNLHFDLTHACMCVCACVCLYIHTYVCL